jgi:hypothetical protein
MVARRRGARKGQQQAERSCQDTLALAAETTAAIVKADRQRKCGPSLQPSVDEVLAAIESLYADGLKPFGRILRKRVAELALIQATGVVQRYNEKCLCDVDNKHLLSTCEGSARLQIEPEEGGDWSALIIGRSHAFVDVYSAVDVFPAAMWDEAATHFRHLSGDDMYLPGGRYSCAQELKARNLMFLRGRSLGEICHFVQLAISQKKILGHLSGAVVPYSYSQSMLKDQCAQLHAPCKASLAVSTSGFAPAAAENSLAMATWDTTRQYLSKILDTSAQANPGAVGKVPLSNVKRLFRSRFQTELSETKLGHSKLSELLQDERLHDICMVQLQGNGYTVLQVKSLDDVSCTAFGDVLPQKFCAEEPLKIGLNDMDVLGKERWTPANVVSLVQRTFIHASPPPPSPMPNAKRRSASLPKDVSLGSESIAGKYRCPSFGYESAGSQTEETASTADAACESTSDVGDSSRSTSRRSTEAPLDNPIKVSLNDCAAGSLMKQALKFGDRTSMDVFDVDEERGSNRHSQFCPDEPLAFDDITSSLDVAVQGPLTQTPASMYTHPSALSWSLNDQDFQECRSPFYVGVVNHDEAEQPRRCLQFCADEPLVLEELGVSSETVSLAQTPTSKQMHYSGAHWSCISPLSLIRDGRVGSIALSKVQNTFIHSPLPPPTPLRADASCRSQSLPRNVGSSRDAWETTCQALGCASAVGCEYISVPDISATQHAMAQHVPPSPALTASPMYRDLHQFDFSAPYHMPLMLEPPTAKHHYALAAAESTFGSDVKATAQNVISLANLLG